MCNFRILFVVFFLLLLDKVEVLENGVARTPPMGWMSWGYYECGLKCEKGSDKCLNEDLIISVADAFYNEGYLDAGYEYIIIDDCWSELKRGWDGRLVADRKRFPRGMKFLADYIHSKGLKFGMYMNIAKVTCKNYPGSKDFYDIDVKTFTEWGFDYLKVDGCFVGKKDLNTDYIKLGNELTKVGKPIVYSCSWPYYIKFIIKEEPDLNKTAQHCNLWRNYHDVFLNWPSVAYIIDYFRDNYEQMAPYHGPGHWNDPDMLVVGTNQLTDGQNRIQMTVYAMLSAPLLISCDMAKVTPYEKELLQNLDLLAVAQDPLGIMAKPYTLDTGPVMWVKPQLPMKGDQYPSYSFAFVNFEETIADVDIEPFNYGLNSTDGYTVLDVFSGEFLFNVTKGDKISTELPPLDVVMYTLFPL